jgi:ABC-type transporter Mla subunit MlaD
MRQAVAIAATLAAALAAVVLTGATSDGGEAREYKIHFDNAFGLVEGGDFRVGGVRAGQTKSFAIVKRDGRALAEVTAEISEPGFGELREDATCTIKPQSLIGEYYVDCQPGEDGPLPEGGVVPADQTEPTIPQDLVNDVLRRPYRERLRVIISTLGTGLAGRPDDISEVLHRAHPGLRETSRTLKILGRQNRIIENFVADADTVIGELEANKRDVVRWVAETGRTAEISATRREDIRRSFQKLPRFLDELRPTMARLGELAEEQTPLLADVQEAAPDLDRLIGNLGPFAEASRPALHALGDASETGAAAFREGADEVEELKILARDAPPFAKPLRQYLQTLDDRKRAIEDDPRAAVGSPPAPDPTAIPAGATGGFTGMEAFWNYFYWQGLALNGFDGVSHILRVSAVLSDCSEMETAYGDEPDDPEVYAECNSWLGPHQPGINAPDPTAAGAPAARRQAQAEAPASRRGERRAPGEPDAGPLPGQPDISRPQVRLPQELEELLKRLTPNEQGQIPLVEELLNDGPPGTGLTPAPGGGQSPNELLNFLLGP